MLARVLCSVVVIVCLGICADCSADLVGWWKLDEGSGTTIHDSANGNDGSVEGATWVDDPVRQWCLGFDGDGDYVEIPHADTLNLISEGTVTAWVRLNGATRQGIVTKQPSTSAGNYHLITGSNGTMLFGICNSTWSEKVQPATSGQAITDEWAFYAGTFSPSTVCLYENGVLASSKDNTITPLVTDYAVVIGRWPYSTNWDCDGLISDVRIYDSELSEVDIGRLMRGGGPALHLAYEPSPANRTVDISPDTILSWTPGENAQQHDVYFGTDFNDVNDADTSSVGIYQGRQGYDANSYSPGGILEFNQFYYWRIDEVGDPNIWRGDVWSFTVAGYVVVDDMESYDDYDNRVYGTWLDYYSNNSGATIGHLDPPFTEQTEVHGGKQSMPYRYDNDGTVNEGTTYEKTGTYYYSEAERTFQTAQDWTQYDVDALVLYFYGSASNDANEQMYVELEDGDNPSHSKKLSYDGMASDLNEESWHEWNIDLQDFTAVNLTNVKKITIGFGDGTAPTGSGTGMVYFDDIRLYPTRCVPKYGPQGDITDDCTVDFGDVLVLAGDWLQTDHSVDAAEPDPAWSVGWWKLDEGSGRTVANSGGVSDGTTVGATWVEDSVRGWCLQFDGDGDYVGIEQDESLTLISEGTVTAWVKLNRAEREAIVTKQIGTNTGNYHLMTGSNGTMLFGITNNVWSEKVQAVMPSPAITHEWAFYAGTFDSSTVSVYENGVLAKSVSNTITPLATEQPLMIGRWQYSTSWDCDGLISDVRVYNHALSETEVAGVMGLSELYFPITSRANLYNEEPKDSRSINSNDLAVLAEDWLETRFWPYQE